MTSTAASAATQKRPHGADVPGWTPEKVAMLVQLWPNRNLTQIDIANRIGMTPGAVCNKAKRIGLPRRDGVGPLRTVTLKPVGRMWTDEAIKRAAYMTTEGLDPAEIGRRIGKTAGAVKDKMQRLGIKGPWMRPSQYQPQRHGGGWNDERSEMLKKLWAEGLSASQIAGRLGGVSRNAVIGKIHRLGLVGRETTSRQKAAAGGWRAALHAQRMRPIQRPATVAVPVRASAPVQEPELQFTMPEDLPMIDEIPAPRTGVKLLDLKAFGSEENMCRWPLGDPRHESFRFCGCTTKPGATYCEHHARIAYRPIQRRHVPQQAFATA